jgi:hypothetical protein
MAVLHPPEGDHPAHPDDRIGENQADDESEQAQDSEEKQVEPVVGGRGSLVPLGILVLHLSSRSTVIWRPFNKPNL